MKMRKRRKQSDGFALYTVLIVALGAALAWWSTSRWGQPAWGHVAFFWVFNTLADYLGTVDVPIARLSLVEDDARSGARLSPGFVVLFTAALATAPPTAIAVAFLPSILELLKRRDRRVLKLVFNSAQAAIYVGVASVVFDVLGSSGVPAFVAAAAVAVVAYVLNTLLVAGALALMSGMTWKDIARRMTWTIPHTVAFGLVIVMVATLYKEFGPISAVFLFMPLAALRFVRQAKLGLDGARDNALLGFVRAVEEKDPYTFRHSERVAEITVALHRELGSKPGALDKRWYAAVLHDVGKVGVPIEVLTKPGQLEPWEYEEIKKHPGLGAEVVGEIDLFKELSAEIRGHHERVDGHGYPDGLEGDAIPFTARVLAVADAFEALTSDRPYRRALSTKEALDELNRSVGQQHDPVALDALRRVLERGVSFVRPTPIVQSRREVSVERAAASGDR